MKSGNLLTSSDKTKAWVRLPWYNWVGRWNSCDQRPQVQICRCPRASYPTSNSSSGVAQWPVVDLGSSHAGCEAEPCWEKRKELREPFLGKQRLQEKASKITQFKFPLKLKLLPFLIIKSLPQNMVDIVESEWKYSLKVAWNCSLAQCLT